MTLLGPDCGYIQQLPPYWDMISKTKMQTQMFLLFHYFRPLKVHLQNSKQLEFSNEVWHVRILRLSRIFGINTWCCILFFHFYPVSAQDQCIPVFGMSVSKVDSIIYNSVSDSGVTCERCLHLNTFTTDTLGFQKKSNCKAIMTKLCALFSSIDHKRTQNYTSLLGYVTCVGRIRLKL